MSIEIDQACRHMSQLTTRTYPNLVGVVHNSLRHQDGYRCGIRFRTQSNAQFDRQAVERQLIEIEGMIASSGLDEILASAAGSSGSH